MRSVLSVFFLVAVLFIPVFIGDAYAVYGGASIFSRLTDGDLEGVQTLLDQGVNPNAIAWHGRAPRGYPIVLAVMGDRYEIVRLLLARGADPNVPRNPTPLMLAVERGSIRTVRLLLAQGAFVDTKNARGETALFRAIRIKEREIATLLLDYGADPKIVDMRGETPLIAAIRSGDLPIAEMLISRGARMDMQSYTAALDGGFFGWTPAAIFRNETELEMEQVVCEKAFATRSYSDLVRFLGRNPDVRCGEIVRSRLDGFSREYAAEPRFIRWEDPIMHESLFLSKGIGAGRWPQTGSTALEIAQSSGGSDIRVRHIHGETDLRLGDFILLRRESAIPGTNVRAEPANVVIRESENDGYVTVEAMDHFGIWVLNDMMLVRVGSVIDFRLADPLHLFGLDLLGGRVTVYADGLMVDEGTVIYYLPW